MAKNKKDNFEYYGQHELPTLQNKYFAHYDYNFWIHKAHALLHIIENPESANGLKFEGDIFDYEVIIIGLKMELHMTAMHCIESFFRIIQAMLFNPQNPWLGMAECKPDQLRKFITLTKENGITPLTATSASDWLRANIYPTINETHERYERAKKSIDDFVIPYLQRLAYEFSTHTEYNAYKHGLHCFPAIGTSQALDDTGQKYLDSTNDIIQYLDIRIVGKNKKMVGITDKSYSNKVDYNIIRVNSAILHNLHLYKSIAAGDRMAGIDNAPIKHGYYYFDDWTAKQVFEDKSSGPVKKFTY